MGISGAAGAATIRFYPRVLAVGWRIAEVRADPDAGEAKRPPMVLRLGQVRHENEYTFVRREQITASGKK